MGYELSEEIALKNNHYYYYYYYYPFIVASFNAQLVRGSDMASKRCEISTFIKDNGVDLFL